MQLLNCGYGAMLQLPTNLGPTAVPDAAAQQYSSTLLSLRLSGVHSFPGFALPEQVASYPGGLCIMAAPGPTSIPMPMTAPCQVPLPGHFLRSQSVSGVLAQSLELAGSHPAGLSNSLSSPVPLSSSHIPNAFRPPLVQGSWQAGVCGSKYSLALPQALVTSLIHLPRKLSG